MDIKIKAHMHRMKVRASRSDDERLRSSLHWLSSGGVVSRVHSIRCHRASSRHIWFHFLVRVRDTTGTITGEIGGSDFQIFLSFFFFYYFFDVCPVFQPGYVSKLKINQ